MIALVVACAANGTIGRDGALPWHLPADMRHFRELTTGHTVLMGRKTYESLPARYRPLPERRNLVLSSSAELELPGAEVFHNVSSALEACAGECFVIGGSAVYQKTIPLADRVHATEIEQDVEGDAFFPKLSPSQWRCAERGERIVESELAFNFAVYERI
ncbi:MAG TPA: dihydrofolate reductase [Solirubrobacteraceae bacterium]|nr:dihydrofolate reductase [Solirubrobacteraceae bacterium]